MKIKIARRCGAKRVCKSKCTKHLRADHFLKLGGGKLHAAVSEKHIFKLKCIKHILGPLFEVAMSKNGRPL